MSRGTLLPMVKFDRNEKDEIQRMSFYHAVAKHHFWHESAKQSWTRHRDWWRDTWSTLNHYKTVEGQRLAIMLHPSQQTF